MSQQQRREEDGPKIHRAVQQKDRISKHRNLIYDLLDEEDFDEDEIDDSLDEEYLNYIDDPYAYDTEDDIDDE